MYCNIQQIKSAKSLNIPGNERDPNDNRTSRRRSVSTGMLIDEYDVREGPTVADGR